MARGRSPVARVWALARAGELRGALASARALLAAAQLGATERAELHLACASTAMRQGDHACAMQDLDEAARIARAAGDVHLSSRAETWRAELAYFQGRYSDADAIVARLLPRLQSSRDEAYSAFALRIRIAILLARRDYEAIDAVAERAVRHAQASGDAYVRVQVLNVLGAAHFDRATTKLREPHARAHLSALDPADTSPMEDDARAALRCFEQAQAVAKRARLHFAAWYVAGNIERLEILLGNARGAVLAIRKRLRVLQERGARYDEIVTRSNLAWGLRLLGRHAEALHELDVAFRLARETRTANVLLEFLEYDRSIVLDALGETGAARSSYRRYLQLHGAGGDPDGCASTPARKRPLEPYYLKRADRFLRDRLGTPFTIAQLAGHCGVSARTLEKAFVEFRGVTPVAHARNVRLDEAHRALGRAGATVSGVAARLGFASVPTFSLEYRKRFGTSPGRGRRARAAAEPVRDAPAARGARALRGHPSS